MIRATSFAGKRVAVFGLGGSGIAAAQSLIAGGAEVVCWDDGEEARARAHSEGLQLADLKETDWSSLASLVLAPGVPLTHPAPHWTVGLAQGHGVEIIGDIEIFARERERKCPSAPFLAITGTNGKSTTTALIAHLLAELGHNVEMGGNIGRAILSLEPPAPNRIHVVELSSFQIDLTLTLKPTVGLLLNITPDHIDRHGTLAHYAEIKERLLKEASACAVGIDDPLTRKVAERIDPERLYAFTAGKGAGLVPRFYAIGPTLFAHEQAGAYATSEEIADLEGIGSLRGRHNVQNALGALAALRALQHLADTGVADLTACDANGEPTIWRPRQLAEGLRSFAGLPHRMEEIGRLGKVLFINDSKATNAEAAEKAFSCFKDGIYWIAGGRAKTGGIEALEAHFPRIAKAYLFGEAEDLFAATLEGRASYERCGTLTAAIARASADAASSGASKPVVLFSPACASFDQFRNFEVRGDAFRNQVKSLPGITLREASQ
jgi:UDP-N-acetylmuramoylalanine--D-glutamate ligase